MASPARAALSVGREQTPILTLLIKVQRIPSAAISSHNSTGFDLKYVRNIRHDWDQMVTLTCFQKNSSLY